MTLTNHHPDSDVSWYKLKSSGIMMLATIIAVIGIAHEYMTSDSPTVADFQLDERGRIVSSQELGTAAR